jgi:hypothetical protein
MKKLIFAFTCLFLAVPCQARIFFVDDDDIGVNNGSSLGGATNLCVIFENQDNKDLSGIFAGLMV